MVSFRVFLSHSTKDGEFVRKLATELERELITPWLCEVDIIPGRNFVEEIEQGLRSSDLVIVAWSPDAARSRWTDLEWASVLDREISESRQRLGLVLLKDAKLPELLRTKLWIDARGDIDKGIRETVCWVKRLRDMRRDAGIKATNFFLDYEPRDFVGRAEHMEALYAALAEQPGTLLLQGEAGCGKSTLALKFGWQFQGAFDAVIFQACGQRTANEIGMELAARLKLSTGSQPPEKQTEMAMHWLRERRSLLVLDDVWNQDAMQLMPGPPASVLITSRHRSLPWIAAGATREMKSFSREEAETVFRIHLGDDAVARYRDILLQLAERVERLPIAVVVAAYVLKHDLDPVDRAAPDLRIEQLCDAARDVPGLFQRAIESQPASARTLLRAASVCASNGFWLPLAGTIAGMNEKERGEARDQLVGVSLLRVIDRARQRFQIHALLREQLRKDAAIDDLRKKHCRALEEIFGNWEDRWQDCLDCLPEIVPAMDCLWQAGEPDRCCSLADRGSSAAKRVGELEIALAILKREESLFADRGDETARNILQECYGNQAVILRAWGRLDDAVSLLKRQEALCLELNNKDGLWACYCNQAGIIKEWGRLKEAMALLKRMESLCLELNQKNGLAAAYCNQAVILLDWAQLPEALELLRKQESLCLEINDKNGLQACYDNLAFIMRTWGRLEDAMALHKKEEALCLEIGNKDGLQACYGAIGSLLYAMGQPEQAMSYFKKQEALCLELSNKHSLHACYGEQALILSDGGRFREAMQLLREEESICLALANKSGLASCYGKQAVLQRKQEHYQDALKLLEKQEALCLELDDRIELAQCCWNWGLVAGDLKEKDTAVQRLTQARDVFAALNMQRQRDSVQAALDRIALPKRSPAKTGRSGKRGRASRGKPARK